MIDSPMVQDMRSCPLYLPSFTALDVEELSFGFRSDDDSIETVPSGEDLDKESVTDVLEVVAEKTKRVHGPRGGKVTKISEDTLIHRDIPLMDDVAAAALEISNLAANQGFAVHIPCALLAHRYYMLHVPAKVNLLVMAESHAATPLGVVGAPIVLGDNIPLPLRKELEAGHIGHLNLVHSLSYGEPWMLGGTKEYNGLSMALVLRQSERALSLR